MTPVEPMLPVTPPATLWKLERILARVLQAGTVVASTTIGLGLLVDLAGWHPGIPTPWATVRIDLMTVGIAGFILLPTVRVIVMLGAYLSRRDKRLSMISAAVLTIIVAAVIVGLSYGGGT